ncbi:MAG: hypothetical protein U1G05_13990 [Kiritimatiellia bacterium]
MFFRDGGKKSPAHPETARPRFRPPRRARRPEPRDHRRRQRPADADGRGTVQSRHRPRAALLIEARQLKDQDKLLEAREKAREALAGTRNPEAIQGRRRCWAA